MPVKIRLARRGRRKRPYYHIVVADSRAPRDGKFIESIGFYNPMTVPASIELDRDKAFDWISKGAQPTDTARAILKFKGVYYKKHLLRGVAKGALTEEKANEMYEAWIADKEAKVAARKADTAKERENFWKMVSGEIKPPKKVANEEAAEAFRETEAEGESSEIAVDASAEEPAAEAEATAEETPVAEAETPAEETPAPEAEAPTEEPKAETEAPAEEPAAPEAEAPAAEEAKEEE